MGTGPLIRLLNLPPMEVAMSNRMGKGSVVQQPIKASATERASIRALKNWLLSAPQDNPLQDQIVRLRLADAIANLSRGALQRRHG